MRVQATRGVCVGIGQNMAKEEVRELDDDTARYLKAIGAVKDAPADRTNQDSAGKSK